MKIHIQHINQIQQAAQKFLSLINNQKVIAFFGEMGVGKTTLIKALCKELDVKDEVTSPTFALINEYKTNSDESIYHFDFYRIDSIQEAMDFGYEEYFFSNNFCFIEWPEKIDELLPSDSVKVYITENKNGSRSIDWNT
jgi:tRNA threonylcarbamoyladenosine biosynthesis protein TsaE